LRTLFYAGLERSERAAGDLGAEQVSVEFGGECFVLDMQTCFLYVVLAEELVQLLIATVTSKIELVRVPVFREDCFDIVLRHLEMLPVKLCALLADERAESHVEVRALVSEAVDAVTVVLVVRHELEQLLPLVFRLALQFELSFIR